MVLLPKITKAYQLSCACRHWPSKILKHNGRNLACHQSRWQTTSSQPSMMLLQGKEDRFKSIHVDLSYLPKDIPTDDFSLMLKASVEGWQQDGCPAVWLKVPITQGHIISAAAQEGFVFHHAEGSQATLCQWLSPDTPSRLPQFATHQVGVAGCVIREDTKEVLVVREKNRPLVAWKYPGGLSELGEDIGQTAEREVFEETGVKSEFQGILAFRQQHEHPGAFGRSDIFFLCHLVPLTFDISPCTKEIEACRWIGLDELSEATKNSHLLQQIIKILRYGLQRGLKHATLTGAEFDSVHKGKTFKLYHRHIPDY